MTETPVPTITKLPKKTSSKAVNITKAVVASVFAAAAFVGAGYLIGKTDWKHVEIPTLVSE